MVSADIVTPAFLYDIAVMRRSINLLRDCGGRQPNIRILFTLKACSIPAVLEQFSDAVDGWAVSSPYELLLAKERTLEGHTMHLSSPGLSPAWFDAAIPPDFVSFNSLSQMYRCVEVLPTETSAGVRLNPKLSTVRDPRYDACRAYSKLGISVDDFIAAWNKGLLPEIGGLHVHNACLSDSWMPLLRNVRKLQDRCNAILRDCKWINLGGGHIWNQTTDFEPLCEAIDLLSANYDLQIFVEPGAGIINAGGCLIASVIDLFESDGKTVAILDTSVNHLPEVFEYQFEPDLREHIENGKYNYILAGCSCLAGDVFGEYSFNDELEVGTRMTFENVGAYSIVKAHMFNGINLPSLYLVGQNGEFSLIKEFTFEDFTSRCGLISHEYASY